MKLSFGAMSRLWTIVHKTQWLDSLPAYRLDSQSIDEMTVHIYGDTAVVIMAYRQTGPALGNRNISGNFLITDIWLKTPQGWRVVERHSSRQEKLPAVK